MTARIVFLVVLVGSLSAPGAAVEIDPNLVGWWNFEEGGGTVAVDSSGRGNDGTLMGDPQWVAGYDGLALELDGEGDYVEIGKVASELGVGGSAARTIALWAYARVFDGGGLYEMGGDGLRERFSLRTREEERWWQAQYGGIDANFVSYPADEWVHLTHVYGGSWAEVYVNSDYPEGRQLVLDTRDDTPLRIGTSGGASFDGWIDDVRLYDRAVAWDEVRRIMYGSPLLSWGPQPEDGVLTDIARAAVLRWEAGAIAVEHDVYFGRDEAAVREATASTGGIYRGRQVLGMTHYAIPEQPLEWEGTYYWRVDEINVDGTVTRGKVWGFETADYLIVDDFEDYNDEDNRIYDTWIDGWDNGTGSTVGYFEASFARVLIVHGGWQSMPFSYQNEGLPWYSEAFRTWETPVDWTRYGVETLTLYFLGVPVAYFERPDGSVVMGGGGTVEHDTESGLSYANRILKGDGSITVRVDHVVETGAGAQAGVMIRSGLDGTAAQAAVTVTAGNGVVFWYRRGEEGATERVTQAGLEAPYWVRLVREGATLTASCSADGVQWVGVADDPGACSVEIAMDQEVYVGLAVASDLYATATSATFSNIALTGDLKGPWWVDEIGSKYSYVGNAPDRMYVGLVDEAGNVGVVNHPDDPLAVGAAVWERWDIGLSEFAAAGVDLTRITQMLIGVGDRDNPAAGGEGLMHFDDIRLTRSEGSEGVGVD